jgi:hypothetical protein
MTTPLIVPAKGEHAPDVRAFELSHLSDVARLFHKIFRGNKGAVPASLAPYLKEIFFEHPWRDEDLPSLVHVSQDGRVDGFIGVLPLRLKLNGKKVRAAVYGSLMVEEPEKNPLTGARLMRKVILGPQDISISETANPVSQAMHARLGGRVLPLNSMEWLMVIKPLGTTVALASRVAGVLKVLAPFARAGDAVLSRWKSGQSKSERPAPAAFTRGEDASEERFIAYALRSAAQFALRPDWNETVLKWLLTHAAAKEEHGPMVRRLVYGKGDTPIGGYIAYMRPGGLAWVLQILTEPGRAGPVLDDLAAYAQSHGAVALRGRTHPTLMEPLLKRGCVFLQRSATIVHASDETLMAAAAQDGLINGLAAESWSRLIGGVFR